MQWTSLGRAGGRRDGGSDLFLCLLGWKKGREKKQKEIFIHSITDFNILPHNSHPNIALYVKQFFFLIAAFVPPCISQM